MKIAVVTPVHLATLPYLEDAKDSLARQTDRAFHWVIVPNGGARVPGSLRCDRVHVYPSRLAGIGALKRYGCEEAKALGADIVVELDADDLLVPTAIARLRAAFDLGADFVYSDFAEFRDDRSSWPGYPYRSDCGWKTKPVRARVAGEKRALVAMKAPEATAHNVRRVEWAPNHVRAWRMKAYDEVGGHDASMAVGDDHDLVVRFFLAGKRFVHIPKCLYLYRVHDRNTVASENAAIQVATEKVYSRQIGALADLWTREKDLLKVDLCGGIDSPEGYIRLDKRGDGVTVCDLDGSWPLADSSVGILRAYDAVEHLRDPVHTMNEAFRVLAPGGFFFISVPSTSGLGAFCDPTHVSFWNKLSFRYYTSARFARYVPEFRGRFQTSRVLEWFPSDWHKAENVPYVEAHLFCAKDGFRAMGEWGWD